MTTKYVTYVGEQLDQHSFVAERSALSKGSRATQAVDWRWLIGQLCLDDG